jgi:flagellar motor switch protein FliM
MTNREHSADPGFDEPLVLIGEATLDRMPGLALIFEETAAGFSRFLGQYEEGVVLTMDGLEALRVGELTENFGGIGRTFVYRAAGLEARAALAVDDAFHRLTFELLLGSNIVAPACERPMTRIEDAILGFAAFRLLDQVAAAFASIAPVSFERDWGAEEAGFFSLGPKAAVAVLVRLSLQYREHSGQALLALPRTALDPFRNILARAPGAEGQATDEKWSVNLYDNVVRTEVTAEVKIEARGFTLGDVARLEVGDVLRLPIAPTSPIRVVSEGRTLFWCTLGQKDGKYTVRLEEFSDERESYIENILGV